MLKQALITLLVAAIVIVAARIQRARRAAHEQKPFAESGAEEWYRSATAIVGFIFAGIVIFSTTAVTGYRYWHASQIVQVEVIDPSSGSRTVYQVKRRDLGEREFRTVDGRRVLLGSGDRVERVD